MVVAAAALYLVLTATVLAPADTHGARVSHLTVKSEAVGEERDVSVVLPPGEPGDGEERPLLVFLHGRGGSADTFTDDEAMFAALASLGSRAPIVAFPDGDDHSYWHGRDSGDWDAYVVHEVIPQVARRFDADPHRIAIGGISMGGFGAYDLGSTTPAASAPWAATHRPSG